MAVAWILNSPGAGRNHMRATLGMVAILGVTLATAAGCDDVLDELENLVRNGHGGSGSGAGGASGGEAGAGGSIAADAGGEAGAGGAPDGGSPHTCGGP